MISAIGRELYFYLHDVPRFIIHLAACTGDTEEDIHAYADYVDGIESDYKRHYKPDVFGFRRELLDTFPELQPPKSKDGITEDMIRKAREFPITELIDHKRMWAVCPFHADTNPSLFLKKNFFHCFVCEESGDTIKLVMHQYNCDFRAAVKVLNDL